MTPEFAVAAVSVVLAIVGIVYSARQVALAKTQPQPQRDTGVMRLMLDDQSKQRAEWRAIISAQQAALLLRTEKLESQAEDCNNSLEALTMKHVLQGQELGLVSYELVRIKAQLQECMDRHYGAVGSGPTIGR